MTDTCLLPVLSTVVTVHGEDTGGVPDDLFGPGWWVGSDGNWHTPDEQFGADEPRGNHPIRRLVVVLLAIALIGATSAGVWGGVFSSQGSTAVGPPISGLDTQVQLAVSGVGTGGFGVKGVVSAACHPPSSWFAGKTFTCDVFGAAGRRLGEYQATVQSTTPSGEWRWTGTWKPNRHAAVTTL